MNPAPDDFEALRKLMALKRHEQPPAEYLKDLPDRIITRIEHGEGRLSLLDKLSARLAVRPSLAYACGLTVCGALGLTAAYLARQGVRQAQNVSGVALNAPLTAGSFAVQFEPSGQAEPQIHVAGWLRNTNPSDILPALSLFSTSHNVVQVSYPSGN